jgi:hypothetical protein
LPPPTSGGWLQSGGGRLGKGLRGRRVGMVWREAPALADPFRGAQKRAVPHRYTAPAGGGKMPKGGWFVTFWGESGRGGVWSIKRAIQ